jgi:hypothetical protein
MRFQIRNTTSFLPSFFVHTVRKVFAAIIYCWVDPTFENIPDPTPKSRPNKKVKIFKNS